MVSRPGTVWEVRQSLGDPRRWLPEPLQDLVDSFALGDDHHYDYQLFVSHLVDDAVLASDAADVYAPVARVFALQLLAVGGPRLFSEVLYSVLYPLAGLALRNLVYGLAGAALGTDGVRRHALVQAM